MSGRYVHITAGFHRNEKTLDPLELEIQAGMSHLTQMLGTKLGSSTVSSFNCVPVRQGLPC